MQIVTRSWQRRQEARVRSATASVRGGTAATVLPATRVAAIQRLKEFREAYAEAIQRFNEGEYDVEFPYGTWGMRRHGVCIADAPRS